MSQYNIFILNNVLQKTKVNTLEDTAAERHQNSTCNRSGVIAHLELLIKESQNLFQLPSSRFVRQGEIAKLSTLMVGTQQVQEIMICRV
jgi:hypothetical protein